MGAPSPDLCNLWLARAFNAQDVEAAAAMYHPEASIVRIDQVHGGTSTARGAEAIRETMAAYIGLKPHMDVITHHTTISGDFAMTRSQWLIRGVDRDGNPVEVPSRDGGAPQAGGRHLGVLHRSPVRRRPRMGGRRTAAHGIAAGGLSR